MPPFKAIEKQVPQLQGEKLADIEVRKWAGFEQILKTPPQPGEPTRKFRDYDGVNGTEVVWSDESQCWEFTGLRLQDIPPAEGQPTTRTNLSDRKFTWSPERSRWWGS